MSLLATITITIRYDATGPMPVGTRTEARRLLQESITEALMKDPSVLDPGDLMIQENGVSINVKLTQWKGVT